MDNSEFYDFNRRFMILENMITDIYDMTVTDKRVCPLCNNEIRVYLPFGHPLRRNALCPCCGSLERHRALWLYLKNYTKILTSGKETKILHFAPELLLQKMFSVITSIDYYPVDKNPNFVGIRDVVDIQKIKYPDNMFDVIICIHVMEHILDEKAAIKQMCRVLKRDGVAYINVPVRTNMADTFENPEYNTPELRLKHYGQDDHVRIYGNDFSKRLEKGGFIVEVIQPNKVFSDKEISKFGIHRDERIYKCTV